MESKFEIGQKLKNKRLELNLRMDDVAKEVGVTRSTLWAIENGSGNYTIDTLLRLVSFLNMSIDIGAQKQGTRKRATRTNSALDKKINRFIVMCVEQYASSVNQSSGTIYNELNKAGIIDELKEDYEDMHGMSTYSINEYIGKRLDADVSQEPTNDNHILSKTILISQTIELIAKKYKLSIEESRNRFYQSDVIEMLDDDETGLYGESALYLLSLYENYFKNKCIETERLLLRKPRIEDAKPMFDNWANDPEVTKYLTWNPHENIEVTKTIITCWLEEEKDSKTIRFIITLKDGGEPIGSIDVVNYIDDNPEIGYCLSKKYWNQGLMTEACKAFVKYLFNKGFNKVLIKAVVENIGSNRVIEKCGFKFTHQEHLKHQSSFKLNPVTVNCYELVK
ncbi:MAG: GNAT family N-acetyltransferase [Bacilli bacterium]|nr:GNAT family N-acetyltransferase [Bacilli bacterium]